MEASHVMPFADKDTAWDRRLINGAINGPIFFAKFHRALPNFDTDCQPWTIAFRAPTIILVIIPATATIFSFSHCLNFSKRDIPCSCWYLTSSFSYCSIILSPASLLLSSNSWYLSSSSVLLCSSIVLSIVFWKSSICIYSAPFLPILDSISIVSDGNKDPLTTLISS